MAKYKKLSKDNINQKLRKRIRRRFGYENNEVVENLVDIFSSLLDSNEQVYLAKDVNDIISFQRTTAKYLNFETLQLKDNVFRAHFHTLDNKPICVCALSF